MNDSSHDSPLVKVNGKIRAAQVRVIGIDGRQLGILPLSEALNLARAHGVDLVEIASTATPPGLPHRRLREVPSRKCQER